MGPALDDRVHEVVPQVFEVLEFGPIQCVGVRGQNHMSDRSRQSVARCWGVC